MRHLALFTLLSTAGLIACSKSPLGPTQATTAGTAAATPNPVAAPASNASDCEQTGENTGECGIPGWRRDGRPITSSPNPQQPRSEAT